MKNIFNVKFAKNEFNIIKTILFLFTIVYTFVIIVAYTSNNSYNARINEYNEYLDISYIIFTQFTYYTSIFIISVYSFKYIYNKKAVDMYHSLPLKKTTIFLTKLITDYLSVSLIFAVAFCITSSLVNLSPQNILQLLTLSFLCGLFEFSCFVLVATICNGIFFHTVLTASILLIPTLISALVSFFNELYTFIYPYTDLNTSNFVFGLTPPKIFNAFFIESNWKPYQSFQVSMFNNNTQSIIFVAVLTVFIICLSVYTYNLRKSESLSTYIVFKPVRILFQTSITFIITLLIVMVFLNDTSNILPYIICVILSIAFAFIIDSLLNFRITNIKQNLVYYIIPIISTVAFFNAYDNNLYGFFNTPELSDIQLATIQTSNYWYGDTVAQNNFNAISQTTDTPYNTANVIRLDDPDTINKLLELQDSRFEQLTSTYYSYGRSSIIVSYKLNNNKVVRRQFNFNTPDYADNINYIQSHSSNKQDVLNLLSNAPDTASVTLDLFVPQATRSDSSVTQQDILDALAEDIINDDTFRLVGYQPPIVGMATVSADYDSDSFIVTPINLKLSYTNTLQLLGIDANSFDVLVIPEQDIQIDEVSTSLPYNYVSPTQYAIPDGLPDSYHNSPSGPIAIDELEELLPTVNFTYLTGDNTSLYWSSERYTDDWMESPSHLQSIGNLLKADDSQYYRTFIVRDNKVLMNSEQLVRLPN